MMTDQDQNNSGGTPFDQAGPSQVTVSPPPPPSKKIKS